MIIYPDTYIYIYTSGILIYIYILIVLDISYYILIVFVDSSLLRILFQLSLLIVNPNMIDSYIVDLIPSFPTI